MREYSIAKASDNIENFLTYNLTTRDLNIMFLPWDYSKVSYSSLFKLVRQPNAIATLFVVSIPLTFGATTRVNGSSDLLEGLLHCESLIATN